MSKLKNCEFVEVPPYAAQFVTDDLKDVYFDAVERFGTHDLVLVQDLEIFDDVYAAPRGEFVGMTKAEIAHSLDPGYGLLLGKLLDGMPSPAATMTGAEHSFWFLVMERDKSVHGGGIHCFAIGIRKGGRQ